jgi:cellulose biosynthesis protein BcsQ
MSNSIQNQPNSPLYVSFCTQKGGAGKSVFTTLAASFLHYERGFNVAVIDCDFPQWSVQKLRERESGQIMRNTFYKRKVTMLFQKIKKPAYPVVPVQPENALVKAKAFLKSKNEHYDLVLFDLPGTVNNKSVVEIYFNMDYLFVPLATSRINMESTLYFIVNVNRKGSVQDFRDMESTLYFIVNVNEIIRKNPQIRLKSVQTFWNRISGREKQELSDMYNNALAELDVPVMQTRIPQSVKYDREQSVHGSDYVFLSTIFPPDKPLLKGSNWEEFMDEFLKLTNLQHYGNNNNRNTDF